MSVHDYTNQLIDDRYLATAAVGRGGFGTVYRGKQVRVGRQVAIKVLHADLSSREEVVKRFLLEGRAASAVGHPSTVEVIDVGVTEQGDPYIVMEHLEGESLALLLERNGPKLAPPAAYAIVASVLEGLAAAHEAGVVHRDLKPENVFLVYADGRAPVVKIIDFGIAKVMRDDIETLTETGEVLGTPAFLSPEQARGSRDVDGRSDLYAVGVLLFKMVSGRIPYHATSRNALLAELLNDELHEDDIADDVPAELLPVLMSALQRDRERRVASAEELLALLRALPGFEDRESALAQITADAFETTLPVGDLGLPFDGAPPRSADSVLADLVTLTPRPSSLGHRDQGARRGWLGLAGGAAVIAAVAIMLSRGDEETTPTAAPAASAPTTASAEALRVTITLRGLVPEARVALDGRGFADNPFRVPRSLDKSQLRITAPGYEPITMTIVPDHDQLVNVVLTELPVAPTATASAKPPPPPSGVDLGI